MIEFDDVFKSYDAAHPILKGVSFTIGDGEFVALAGTNGAGKSTAMRLVNGLLLPDKGEVRIDGVPTTSLRTSELARRVGFLFQNPDRQICCPTVRDELLFGFRAQGRDGDEAREQVELIAGELGLDLDADPFLLNRGSRQLLALASIVVLAPPVLVLDEPTTGLDWLECGRVMDVIARMHDRGTTVVMVCHDMEVVADYAERVIMLSDGQVVVDGPTFEVLRDAEALKRASLMPPQIVEVSEQLIREMPALSATAVARANTLDEMERALAQVLAARCGNAAVRRRMAMPKDGESAQERVRDGRGSAKERVR